MVERCVEDPFQAMEWVWEDGLTIICKRGGCLRGRMIGICGNHLKNMWTLIRTWIGIYSVDSACVSDLFLQFGQLGEFSITYQIFLQLVWFYCVWVIWKETN